MKSLNLILLSGAVTVVLAQTPPPSPKPAVTVAPSSPSTAAVGVPAAAPVPTDPKTVVLTVGPDKITLAEYNEIINSLPPQYQAAAKGPQKRAIAERLVQLRVMAREAEKRGVDKSPVVQQQIAFQRENILANALFLDFQKNAKVDDAAARKYYADHKADYETAKGSHILVRYKGSAVPLRPGTKDLTEEEALAKATELKKKLDGGAEFAAMAKAESDDTGSGVNGGDLGTFKHGQMVPAFEAAAFALPVGKVSDPVKTQFGYHLIKMDSKESKTFEQAKAEIVEKMGPDLAKKQADDLRAAAPVTFNDSFFGPNQPAPPQQ